MITYSHDMALFVAAVVVSFVAAFTGLALTNNISHLPDRQRKSLIVMSAFILGGGIWSMHFVAMLAVIINQPVYYDLLQTLGSALVAILVAGLALLMLHFSARTPRLLTLAGLILGMGIVAMHFIGMLGMRGLTPVFSGVAVFFTIGVAAVTGVAAIWAAYGRRSRQNIMAGAAVFGSAVVAVHFTAMHGTRFFSGPPPDSQSVFIGDGTLAVTVTVAVFVICGTFLLAATTFITRPVHAIDAEPLATLAIGRASGLASNAQPSASVGDTVPPAAMSHEAVRVQPDSEETTQPVRVFSHSHEQHGQVDFSPQMPPVNSPGGEATAQIATAPSDTAPIDKAPNETTPKNKEIKIPFERDKKIQFVRSAEVGAIRADGRYTHFYTQSGTFFCPWSITEAEKRLSDTGFYRTHRSYLVNLTQVSGFEKRKDAGVCLFENFPQLSNVPVSRKRVPALSEALGI